MIDINYFIFNDFQENVKKLMNSSEDLCENDVQIKFGDNQIPGQVIEANENEMIFKITEGFTELLKHRTKNVDIVFTYNRTTYQLQHNSLKWMMEHDLFTMFIRNTLYDSNEQCQSTISEYNFICQSSEMLNEEQQTAVKSIVTTHNRPIPFLLFGPPGKRTLQITDFCVRVYFFEIFFYKNLGTGKTRTLIAAIAEIVKSTMNYILVCAHSNAACDEITKRLVKILPNDIYRLYAKSMSVDAISEEIKPVSNINKNAIHFPSLNDLYRHRVLICTLTTSGNLVRARDVEPDFDSGHFSHIFIDEAACVSEILTLIPIAGMCPETIIYIFI